MRMVGIDEAELLLFVTGDAPRSRRARANLEDALTATGRGDTAVCEIDLLVEPQHTFDYGIFATPALVRPARRGENATLYGDLSNRQRLERFLSDGQPVGDTPA